MYQFSRSIYRELATEVTERRPEGGCRARAQLLRSCELAMERLASDRRHFARPARWLFKEVRELFPISAQSHVLTVIESHIALAVDYVERHAQAGMTFDGSPLCCHATTRKGSACQREPLPGSQYCPSHKHLEEGMAVANPSELESAAA